MMGLRLSEGVSMSRYTALAGKNLDEDALHHLASIEMIEMNDDMLRVTVEGRAVLNAVLAELLVN